MLAQNSPLQSRGNRRDKLVIISAMLSHAEKGVCKTELMCKVGMSSAQLERYITVLLQSRLLQVANHDKKALYRTTEKGKSFLDMFDALVRLID